MSCACSFYALEEVRWGITEHTVHVVVEVGLEGAVFLQFCEPLSEVDCCFFSGLNEVGVAACCPARREVVQVGDEGTYFPCQTQDAVPVTIDCDYGAVGLWRGGYWR